MEDYHEKYFGLSGTEENWSAFEEIGAACDVSTVISIKQALLRFAGGSISRKF